MALRLALSSSLQQDQQQTSPRCDWSAVEGTAKTAMPVTLDRVVSHTTIFVDYFPKNSFEALSSLKSTYIKSGLLMIGPAQTCSTEKLFGLTEASCITNIASAGWYVLR